ncbi:hypothetical protein Tco_0081544, partial [Tanacetum coccineum]
MKVCMALDLLMLGYGSDKSSLVPKQSSAWWQQIRCGLVHICLGNLRNCPREGMEGKSFEEGLTEITETLKRLQST